MPNQCHKFFHLEWEGVVVELQPMVMVKDNPMQILVCVALSERGTFCAFCPESLLTESPLILCGGNVSRRLSGANFGSCIGVYFGALCGNFHTLEILIFIRRSFLLNHVFQSCFRRSFGNSSWFPTIFVRVLWVFSFSVRAH